MNAAPFRTIKAGDQSFTITRQEYETISEQIKPNYAGGLGEIHGLPAIDAMHIICDARNMLRMRGMQEDECYHFLTRLLQRAIDSGRALIVIQYLETEGV